MRACPSCGHENPPDVDFCEKCNAYLRWDPTRLVPRVSATHAAQSPAAAPEPRAGEADDDGDTVTEEPVEPGTRVYQAEAGRPPADQTAGLALLTLRLPGSDAGGNELVTAEVEPGGETKVLALVRNQSGIVDNYDIVVEGLPEDWWTVSPPTVYLVPFGAATEGYEQEVEVRLHPPRSAEAEAREWPFMVVAHSKAQEAVIGSVEATLLVHPFHELETEMRPERKAGRFRAKFAIAVRNRSNAPLDVAVAGLDAENRCRFDFESAQFETKPGRLAGTVFFVKPLKQIWIGRAAEHRFTITPQAVGADATGFPRQGVFVQRPWIPVWVPLVVPLLAAAAVAVFLLLPKNTTVPDLSKASSVLEATQLLEKAGLKVGDKTEKQTDKVKPGTITGQSVPAGKEVEEGTAVAIEYAVGTGKAKVPGIVGLTVQQADTTLRKAGFSLGQATPPSTDPKQKIAGQSPPAGELQAEGAAVDIFFAAKKEDVGTTTGGTETGGGNGAELKVPDLAALTGSKILGALVALGLTPNVVSQFSTVPYGKVVSQTPAAGASAQKGGAVKVVVSAGFPDIAYDDGRDVVIMAGATGKQVERIAESSEIEAEPAFDPTGALVAYWRGPSTSQSRIWVVQRGKPQTAHPVTDEGSFDHRPAFSPDGKTIAFIRDKAGDGNLCFVPAAGGTVSCVEDPSTTVTRPAWSPDGKSIIVVARKADSPSFELGLYTSAKPSSADKADWVFQGLVTEKMHPPAPPRSVYFAGWAPDGKRVAFSANWETGVYHLLVAPFKQGKLGDPKPLAAIRACEVAWRPDGRELAIVQSDADCSRHGVVTRVNPGKPNKLVPVKEGIENPAWSPVGRRR